MPSTSVSTVGGAARPRTSRQPSVVMWCRSTSAVSSDGATSGIVPLGTGRQPAEAGGHVENAGSAIELFEGTMAHGDEPVLDHGIGLLAIGPRQLLDRLEQVAVALGPIGGPTRSTRRPRSGPARTTDRS